MDETARPSLFVSSTKEAALLVDAMQVLLDPLCEVVPWNTIFEPGEFTLETLIEKLPEYDFAAIIMTGDDIVQSRGSRCAAPRDNLLVELGMLVVGLGRRRVFVVADRSKHMKVPSDLAGVNLATFQPPIKGTFESALGPACAKMKRVIREMGVRTSSLFA